MPPDIVAFLGLVTIVIVTPGQDTALTIRNTLAGGRPAGATLAAMTLVWLTGYAIVVARAGDVLRRSAVRRALDAVLGGVLIALGVRVALTER